MEHLRPRNEGQLLSIARAQVVQSVARYGRGVRWEQEGLHVHGTRWVVNRPGNPGGSGV